MTPLLYVNDLAVAYDHVQILWNVSFEVGEGEAVAILGSNGAGKTSTLKAIAGLLEPLDGIIEFRGSGIAGKTPHQINELGVALVPEGRRLFPTLTVRENLELGAYTRRARTRLQESLQWIYEIFPVLSERSQQLAGTLSGGEQQMLAIGRALMSHPVLLMLDEPSLGLGPKVVIRTFQAIQTIRKQGVTLLLVEQNVKHALRLVQRAYVMENGRIVLQGSAEELAQDPNVRESYLGL